MTRRKTSWSQVELDWISAMREEPRRAAHALFVSVFDRADVSLLAFTSLCKRRGWLTGRTGCFPKGSVPMSKGKKMPYNANSARTRFKKGQRPHTYRGPGHERVDRKDGYVILIVEERNPWTGAPTRPVHKHRWLWEKVHGPVPEGMRLKCLDGDKTNTDPANWVAIPKGMAARLNGICGRGYDTAPAELKPVIMAAARLEHAAREARKGRDR